MGKNKMQENSPMLSVRYRLQRETEDLTLLDRWKVLAASFRLSMGNKVRY